MPRFAANITLLFQEHSFLDRVDAAAACGFRAVECQMPYAYDAPALRERLDQHDMTLVLHNFPAGDWDNGERGIACDPRKRDQFQKSLETAIDFATTLQCGQLNCLSGLRPAGVPGETLEETFVENLRQAAGELAGHGISLLTEPLNDHDVPGFFLTRFEQAVSLVEKVAHPNFKIQCDIYHLAMMSTAIGKTLSTHKDLIGHIQFADFPARHEPGTGEIDFPALFDQIDELGYEGWVSAEYNPSGTTLQSLGWFSG